MLKPYKNKIPANIAMVVFLFLALVIISACETTHKNLNVKDKNSMPAPEEKVAVEKDVLDGVATDAVMKEEAPVIVHLPEMKVESPAEDLTVELEKAVKEGSEKTVVSEETPVEENKIEESFPEGTTMVTWIPEKKAEEKETINVSAVVDPKTLSAEAAFFNELDDMTEQPYRMVRVVTLDMPLRVRREPSLAAKVVSAVPRNAIVPVFDEDEKWVLVEYAKDKTGWIYKKYTKELD